MRNKNKKLIIGASGALIAGILYFNRNPDRLVPTGYNLVSPADGDIISIQNNRIEIFINITDVHFQRAPCDTIVKYITGDSSYNKMWLSTSFGNIVIERWSGIIARTVITYVNIGDFISKGKEIGRILLGSHCSITVPLNMTIKVSIGDHLLAGETVIAE